MLLFTVVWICLFVHHGISHPLGDAISRNSLLAGKTSSEGVRGKRGNPCGVESTNHKIGPKIGPVDRWNDVTFYPGNENLYFPPPKGPCPSPPQSPPASVLNGGGGNQPNIIVKVPPPPPPVIIRVKGKGCEDDEPLAADPPAKPPANPKPKPETKPDPKPPLSPPSPPSPPPPCDEKPACAACDKPLASPCNSKPFDLGLKLLAMKLCGKTPPCGPPSPPCGPPLMEAPPCLKPPVLCNPCAQLPPIKVDVHKHHHHLLHKHICCHHHHHHHHVYHHHHRNHRNRPRRRRPFMKYTVSETRPSWQSSWESQQSREDPTWENSPPSAWSSWTN